MLWCRKCQAEYYKEWQVKNKEKKSFYWQAFKEGKNKEWAEENRRDRAWNRFFSKVEFGSGNECWVWKARLFQEGYGQFKGLDGKNINAHRWLYLALGGYIEEGWHVDHLCRNRACVNPYHLEGVPPKINTQRGTSHNKEKTHCKNGHPYDNENTRYKRNGLDKWKRDCRKCDALRAT